MSVAPTAQNYFTLFLKGLGLPVTQSNLNALYGVAQLEGWNDRYNPLNVIQQEPGSTSYNSVGVQRFADFDSGVKAAVTLFSNSHWAGVRAALAQGHDAQGVLNAFKAAYTWDPGVQFPMGDPSWGNKTIGGAPGSGAVPQGIAPQDTSATQETGLADSNPDGLGAVLTKIPELKSLLNEAQSQGWSVQKFQQEVENSNWYKTHGQTARSLITLQYSDPATYSQQYARQMATAKQQLAQIGASYGFYNDTNMQANANAVVMGDKSIDQFKQAYANMAKSMFPGLTDQINEGQTVAQIAAPYISSMSSLLEIDPNTLNVTNPLIKKALQGMPDPSSGKTTPSVVPLWQFENQVRQDPRWQYTSNAKQQAASTLMQIGQNFGFNG